MYSNGNILQKTSLHLRTYRVAYRKFFCIKFLPYRFTIDIFTIPSSANCAGFTYCRRLLLLLLLLLLVLSGAFPLALDNENGTATTSRSSSNNNNCCWLKLVSQAQTMASYFWPHNTHSTQHTAHSIHRSRSYAPLARQPVGIVWPAPAAAATAASSAALSAASLSLAFPFFGRMLHLHFLFALWRVEKLSIFSHLKEKTAATAAAKKKQRSSSNNKRQIIFTFAAKKMKARSATTQRTVGRTQLSQYEIYAPV